VIADRFFFFCTATLFLSAPVVIAEENPEPPRHVVLIVWDGMRADFATEKYAPNLDKLARAGVRFRDHHSVYPTATDVNGAALATGCYPNRNGICANLEFRPAIDPRQPIDVSDPDSIKRGDDISGGKYLFVPTFPELLRKVGKTVALVGTKSVSLLFDRHNDWTVVKMQNRPLTIFTGAPANATHRDELIKLLGPFPDGRNATVVQRNDFATRALTEYFWRDRVPDFSLLWLSEPDLSEHNFAPGSPQAVAATKAVDANLGTVLNTLEKKRARESTDVLVVSDHGFSTIRRSIDIVALLNAVGFHASKEISDSAKAGDVLVVGNGGSVMFYVKDHDKVVSEPLVEWLQHSDFAGVIFTREESPGTFSSRAAYLNSDGAPDVVVAFRWFDEKNQFGVAGMIDADWNRKAGEGTHATLSRYDIHNTFVAAGPGFETEKVDAGEPTTNLDLAPTILRIFRVPTAGYPNGHSVIGETKASGEANKPQMLTFQAERKFQDGTWKQSLRVSRDFESQWINEGNGTFEKK
jgi:predicted AlkP superfamily pyrophosphatase or phosphodiesterase